MIKQFFSSRFKYFGAEKIDNYNALHVEGRKGERDWDQTCLKSTQPSPPKEINHLLFMS